MKIKRNHKQNASALHVDESVSLEEQIAQRAHELWQQRGREHGHDLIDWLRAEQEVNEWHQRRFQSTPPQDSMSARHG